jgi:DNA-binding GntR family transcriptional regulator
VKEKLRKAAAAFDAALEKKDVVRIVEKDERFHDVIFEATKNRRLINLAHNLREQVYRYRYEYVKDFSSHDKLSREHARIMEAILEGDVVKAQQSMRGHIYDQQQRVIPFRDQGSAVHAGMPLALKEREIHLTQFVNTVILHCILPPGIAL